MNINVVTVHWRSARWIEPQLSYLERNLDSPFRVFAGVHGIDDRSAMKRFHFVTELDGKHADNLNALAEVVIADSEQDDPLVFLDGDAFPVRPLVPWIVNTLQTYELAAVRRDENLGDVQPHPCFCLTTVRFWKEIQGDWGRGPINSDGPERLDVGGRLLQKLRAEGIEWLPLLRTNTLDLHPLWFAVYGHLVYHHGAGFRRRTSRRSRVGSPLYRPVYEMPTPTIGTLRAKIQENPLALLKVSPRHFSYGKKALTNTVYLRRRKRRLAKDQEAADRVFDQLSSDPDFYLRFDAGPSA
jgi:hypothetical protein